MRTNFYKLTMMAALSLLTINGFAQLDTATFENLSLAPNSYNDGASGSGPFVSGYTTFQNSYNSSWMYWDAGFAYSNQGDTAVSPSDYLTQLYQTKAGTGQNSSANFGIGQQGAKVLFSFTGAGALSYGMYITNTTFAYNSMALGDGIGKKFGDTLNTPHSATGVHGSFPDWFKLSIVGYYGGLATADTVNFYLADYRFANDSLDYIIKDWTYVDLTPLGHVDSISFTMTSSDVGAFGINTPTFFCIDNLVSSLIVTGITAPAVSAGFNAYPNPFENAVKLNFNNSTARTIAVYNALGELVYYEETKSTSTELNTEAFTSGIYFVKVTEGDQSSTLRMIKK